MVTEFVYKNETLNDNSFLITIGVSEYDDTKNSVTFYVLEDGNKHKCPSYLLSTLIEDVEHREYDLTLVGHIPSWSVEKEALKIMNVLWGHLA